MILYLLHKTPGLNKLYFNFLGKKWVGRKIEPFLPYLNEGEKILDIGSGNGLVTWSIRKKGFDCSGLDIESLEFHPEVAPVVYDGKKMPFGDNAFDVGLILSVLHHTENPEEILREAGRVCKRLIVNEDIYRNAFQKKATLMIDSMVNLGYAPCPHTNKDDKGWKMTFEKLGFRLLNTSYLRVLLFFRQGIYHLQTERE